MKRYVHFLSILSAAGLLACIGWTWQAGLRLIVNGNTASTDVRILNGRAYVPLADVARALNMVVVKKPGAYEMTEAGGANQVEGTRQGKVGDVLFSGKWRFQVLSVSQVDTYTERYDRGKHMIEPKSADETLVVVDCRLKNGVKKTQTPVLTERMCGNTALADDQGHSYAPLDFDARQESNKIGSYAAEAMLPGSTADFAIVFSVPKGTTPKALVFTHLNYPDDVGRAGTDVRVTLSR